MPGIIQIHCGAMKSGGGAETLGFDIADLLLLVENEGAKWEWALSPTGEHTYLLGDYLPEFGMTAEEFGNQINKDGLGVLFSWKRLISLSALLGQTIDGAYIACLNKAFFPRLRRLYKEEKRRYVDRGEKEYYQLVEAAFQAVDSSWWLVYAKDDVLLERIASAFSDARTLRTW